LEKLREAKYLDDKEFAHDWALARVENHGYGPVRICQELKAKGIDDKIIDGIIKEIFAAEREKEIAQNVLQKKFKNEDLGNLRILRRAAGYLERRGFSSHVILELLSNSTVENC
jgi:regulatory protein